MHRGRKCWNWNIGDAFLYGYEVADALMGWYLSKVR